MNKKEIDVPFLYRRLQEIQVLRQGHEVKVILPDDLKSWEVGLLIDEALRRAGLHPDQLK